eukprot:scaffold132116_cov19-Prasinocladus_malaysianus.AAC.1
MRCQHHMNATCSCRGSHDLNKVYYVAGFAQNVCASTTDAHSIGPVLFWHHIFCRAIRRVAGRHIGFQLTFTP